MYSVAKKSTIRHRVADQSLPAVDVPEMSRDWGGWLLCDVAEPHDSFWEYCLCGSCCLGRWGVLVQLFVSGSNDAGRNCCSCCSRSVGMRSVAVHLQAVNVLQRVSTGRQLAASKYICVADCSSSNWALLANTRAEPSPTASASPR